MITSAWRVALVAAFVAVTGCRAASPDRELLRRSWEGYRARFVTADGRVVRPEHGGDSVSEGQAYTLLRSKFSEAIFLDDRLRGKELSLKVRLFPKSNVIEVLTIHSVRLGVVQDLFYYCDVCAIKAVSPDPCACCQGPMDLVEQPMSKRDE